MIRPYNEATDFDELIEMYDIAIEKSHNFLTNTIKKQERQLGIALLKKEKPFDDSETWVLGENSKIIGYTTIWRKRLCGIFVLPDYQGNGNGKKLINQAKSLRNQLELAVYAQNSDAHGFYTHMSFHQIKEGYTKDQDLKFKYLVMEWKY